MDIIPLLPIHLITLFLTLGVVLFADHQGFLWIRGKKETLSSKLLTRTHTLMWIGLSTMIVSGLLMALPLREYLAETTAFYFKMFFVLALVVNGIAIGSLMRIPTRRPFAELSQKEKLPLFISGIVSTGSWIGAIIAALNLGL